jgi:hypothetical protein
MLKFLLLVNKQGLTRLSQYFEFTPQSERVAIEAEVVRKCLMRTEQQVRRPVRATIGTPMQCSTMHAC